MNDQMFSVGEIIQSEAFEREAPDEMKFLLHRLKRADERKQSTTDRKENSRLKVGNFRVINGTKRA